MLTDRRHLDESIMFIGVLLFIVAFILFFSADAIMVKMGFETKSVVKAQLVKATEQMNLVTAANSSLQKELDLQIKVRKAVEEDLVNLRATQLTTVRTVSDSKTSLVKRVNPSVQRLQSTTVVSPVGVTSFVTTDMDEVARADIESIQLTYKKLFNT